MPAMARNSVDLPDPEAPVITTDSPGATLACASCQQRRPSGRASVTSVDHQRPPRPAPTGPVPAARATPSIARVKPVSRFTVARHSVSAE